MKAACCSHFASADLRKIISMLQWLLNIAMVFAWSIALWLSQFSFRHNRTDLVPLNLRVLPSTNNSMSLLWGLNSQRIFSWWNGEERFTCTECYKWISSSASVRTEVELAEAWIQRFPARKLYDVYCIIRSNPQIRICDQEKRCSPYAKTFANRDEDQYSEMSKKVRSNDALVKMMWLSCFIACCYSNLIFFRSHLTLTAESSDGHSYLIYNRFVRLTRERTSEQWLHLNEDQTLDRELSLSPPPFMFGET